MTWILCPSNVYGLNSNAVEAKKKTRKTMLMKLRMNYLPVLALNPTTQQAVG